MVSPPFPSFGGEALFFIPAQGNALNAALFVGKRLTRPGVSGIVYLYIMLTTQEVSMKAERSSQKRKHSMRCTKKHLHHPPNLTNKWSAGATFHRSKW